MITEVKPKVLKYGKKTRFLNSHSLSDTKVKHEVSVQRNNGLSLNLINALESNGRLTSKIDYFTIKADGRRIAVDSQLGNVMATLKGTDATDDRVLIISGHLDSELLM
jgi:hypothetical protein